MVILTPRVSSSSSNFATAELGALGQLNCTAHTIFSRNSELVIRHRAGIGGEVPNRSSVEGKIQRRTR